MRHADAARAERDPQLLVLRVGTDRARREGDPAAARRARRRAAPRTRSRPPGSRPSSPDERVVVAGDGERRARRSRGSRPSHGASVSTQTVAAVVADVAQQRTEDQVRHAFRHYPETRRSEASTTHPGLRSGLLRLDEESDRDADARCGARGVRPAARRAGARAGGAQGRRGARAPRGVRRLPHRHVHRLRRRPVRLRAGGARPRGRGRRRGGRRGRRLGRRGRPRRDAVLAPVPRVRALPEPEDEHLPGDPRGAGKGHLPDGTTRLSRDGEPIRHFMGTSTFAEYTVMPEIALAKVSARGAAGPRVPVRLRPVDRPRRGDVHRQGRGRLDVRRVRRRHGRPRRGRRLPAAGRRADRLRRPVRGAPGDGPPPGRDRRHARRPGHRRARSSR